MGERTADEKIKEAVRQAYGSYARRFVDEPASVCGCGPRPARERTAAAETAGCCGPQPARERRTAAESAGCCNPSEPAVGSGGSAVRLYSPEELAGLPESVTGAVAGCGNPTAIAELQPGEVVVDLGSGGGIDCFLAARKVGPTGRVIGLEMTPDMIKLARRNARKMGLANVEFDYGEIEEMPLPDASVDVIISNCVINLSPDKGAVFAEAYRVLRPGGRLSISDIVVDGQLPPAIRSSLDAWAGCIAGALDEADYLGKIREAGFEQVEVVSRDYARIPGEGGWEETVEMLRQAGLSPDALDGKIASIKVKARKRSMSVGSNSA